MAASRGLGAPAEREDTKEVPSRYRVHLLPDAKPTERGVVYRRGERRYLLAWNRVKRALAAQVGEPEGICTIVFDLVVGIDGTECVACRFDADLGEDARSRARAIELGIGSGACTSPLRALAEDGHTGRWYPDLETFEEACLESIRFDPGAESSR
jgi:hypothetical protein